MTHQILTEIAASISELKANPIKVVASGEGMPVAVPSYPANLATQGGRCVANIRDQAEQDEETA